MDNLSKTLGLAGPCKQSGKLTIASFVLFAICLFGRGAEAKYGGGSNTMASAETSTYVFVPDQSAVVQTGGIAGVHETYSIEGQFRLIIDFDTGMASFNQVDANLIDESGLLYERSLGVIFNMAELIGTVVDETTIEFEGKTADGTESDILLTLTFRGDSVHLTGRTVPPPNSADFFIYELDAVAWKKYGSGTGEANGPYLIYTAEQMNAIGSEPNDWDKHFKLMADIDLSGFSYDMALIAPDTNTVKSGFQGSPFTGVFDGNSHTISHLTIVDLTIVGGGYMGLFGRLNSGAVIKNLGVVDVNITGSTAKDYVGGLVGYNESGNVIRCYSTGAVYGDWYVGGLVGYNRSGSVLNCYSTGEVSGSSGVGGLVGCNEGGVTGCYSTGSVNGNNYVGGLVGRNFGAVTECYSTGTVNGYDYVGGLVGSGDTKRVLQSFWDIETSGLTVSAGGVGLTTAEMMDPEILGWNGFGGDPNWILDSGRDYPRLVWEGTPGQMIPEPVIDWLDGTGTPEDPFQIENADQLLLLHKSSLLWDKHFVLNADIDMDPNLPGRSIFAEALIPWFEGSFDGDGHVILNIQIDGRDSVGLFGKLIEGSVVRDLGLENVSVQGTGYSVGGLVGGNSGGCVINCYSTGAVTGYSRVGGLVGWNGGDVTQCYSTAVVSGNSYVGGLVGHHSKGCVLNCYSTGAVYGDWYVGGLVGRGYNVSKSFWDIQTSGQARSAGGTGLTTAEMQLASTFLEAGWDFVDETENGTEDIWWILEGQDYPKLRELPEGLRLRPLRAFCPDPQDGVADVTHPIILRWRLGASAIHHDVYFGEDEEAVGNATTESPHIYRGRQVAELTTYDPGPLEWGKTYYWRIDEVNDADPNSPWKGDVWSFTTADFIVIDDFEDYNDYPPDEIFSTWVDLCFFYSYSICGCLVVYGDPPFAETEIVHGGGQSMPVYYENNFMCSGVIMTLVYPRNWTEEGVGVLSLWFYGDASNAAEPMYVALNGSAVVYHDNPNAAQIATWTEWPIDLQEFAAKGVNLANVNTISIGFGDKNNLVLGGSGRVLFDDIRLYRPRPLSAFSPDPHDGAIDVIQSPILHWVPAEPTLQHDIYFGEGKELVANATTESPGIYRGRQVAEMTTYDPGPLEWGKTYYWRIDEYNTEGTISKGNVWSFTTADFILIDDFEDYNDYPPDEIFSTWCTFGMRIDGWVNGGMVGHADPPFAETEIVHGGKQSMPYFYDNNFEYSEATMTLVSARDWTKEGVGILSLWFYGDASNVAERMYVALNRYASVYHDNPDAVLIEEWTEWTIDLQEFAAQGVNLANANMISIGFGDKNNIKAGGSGMVLFDDIRLYRPAPSEPEPAPKISGGLLKVRTIPDCGGSWTKKITLLWPLRTDLGISPSVDDE